MLRMIAAILLLHQAAGVAQVCSPSWRKTVVPPPPPPGSEAEKALKNAPLRPAQLGGQWGYVDQGGKFFIPPQFDCAEPFADGVAKVELKERFGYIRADGTFVVRPKYFWAGPFSEGFAWVLTRKPWFPIGQGEYGGLALFAKATFINKSGREIRRAFYVEAFPGNFFEGLAWVAPGTGLGWGSCTDAGYMNTKGEWVIKHLGLGGDFSEGLAAVYKSRKCGGAGPFGKWGYIDKSGAVVVPYRYDHAGYFSNGQACVIQGDLWKTIDRNGKERPIEKNGCVHIYPNRPLAPLL
jgi:hypothetical protein